MQQTASKMLVNLPKGRSDPPVQQNVQIPFGDPRYNAVMHFLIEEAYALDQNMFKEWMAFLDEGIVYTIPVRQTTSRDEGSGFYPGMNWIYDDMDSIAFKLTRNLDSDSAFAEDPPSRTRRLVTNMRLFETGTPGEFLAVSSILLRRNRGDNANSDEVSARRDDIIRSADGKLKLVRRTVWLDHTVLGMSNFAVYL